jgi:hypothetical protein
MIVIISITNDYDINFNIKNIASIKQIKIIFKFNDQYHYF